MKILLTFTNLYKKYINIDNVLCIILSLLLCLNLAYTFKIDNSILFILPVFFIFILFFVKKTYKYLINKRFNNSISKRKKTEYITYTVIILAALSFSLFIYYPGTFSPDSISQFNQSISNSYSDWHPLFHTLVFFKLPTLLSKSHLACTLFQCLFITASLLYFCKFCRKYVLDYKKTIILLIFIVANPIFLKMATTMWKDIAFSFCLMLGTIVLIEIFFSDGKWINTKWHKILFSLISFGIIFFRHNGIGSFILMMILLIIFYKKQRKFYVIFTVIFIFAKLIITGPIYQSFNVDSNGGFKEMIGVPCNQMSYIYNNYGSVSEEELSVLNSMVSIEYWETYYDKKQFNGIKWYGDYDGDYIQTHATTILKTWAKMVIKNPKKAIASYVHVTSPIWEIKREINFINDYKDNNTKIANNYNNLFSNSFLRIFVIDVGEGLFLTLLSLALTIKKYKNTLKAYIPYILVLSNVLLIMCLITGGEVRFVYSSILCMYPLFVFSLASKRRNLKNEIKLSDTSKEFIKYTFVGFIAAIVNIGMLYVFTDVLQIYYILSNILAFTLGLITNYILCKKFVFNLENINNKKLEFLIYALIGILGLLLDTFLIWCFVNKIGVHYMIGKIISTIIVFVWNFVLRKVFYKVLGGKL